MYKGHAEIYLNITEEGWVLFEVPEGIDLSQTKIRVSLCIGHFPTTYRKTVTWSLGS